MPLPPLPANNTARVWLKYTSATIPHEMMFRLPAFATSAEAVTKAQNLAAVLALRMNNVDGSLSARFSPAGSFFSVPITHTPVAGSGGTGAWLQDPESVELSFTGRSFADGRDVTYQFFTVVPAAVWPPTNRYLPGFSAPVDTLRLNFAAWVAAAASPAEQVVTIGGAIPTLNAYVNTRANGYWQTAQR